MSDRVDYGIDLGTTNSSIARMDRGDPTVIKNDDQHDTTPSAVAFLRRGRRFVGLSAYNQLRSERLRNVKTGQNTTNVFVEFKRTMGTSHRYVPSVTPDTAWLSEQLSAEVLKKLRSLSVDNEVPAIVVTIPAAFTVAQQKATKEAARLAGFRKCYLLQEPVAAAMAFGLEVGNETQTWLVFDFGGGTFDAALVKVDEGRIEIRDTEGDNHLGGKDLDYAVVDEIILPELMEDYGLTNYLSDSDRRDRLRKGLKSWGEKANIKLSYHRTHELFSDLGDIILEDGREVEFDLEVSRDTVGPVVAPLFQRAIDKCRVLMRRHSLRAEDLDEVILVGGPTLSPTLREMVTEQLKSPNTSVDPMTAVARGAALHASTIPLPPHLRVGRTGGQSSGGRRNGEALLLDVGYEATTINDEELVSVRLQDGALATGLGPLTIEMNRTGFETGDVSLEPDGVLFDLPLERDKGNVFRIVVTDARGNRVDADPSEITIVHGTKLTGTVLPHGLGVAVLTSDDDTPRMRQLKGAEKGVPLPAQGTATLRTRKPLHPGNGQDRLEIRCYQTTSVESVRQDGPPIDLEGAWASLFKLEYVYVLSGMDVGETIPAGTEFHITLVTEDSSSIPTLIEVDFPELDLTFELAEKRTEEQYDILEKDYRNAVSHVNRLRDGGRVERQELNALRDALAGLYRRIEEAQEVNDQDALDQTINLFRGACFELYGLVESQAWPDAIADLDKEWARLRELASGDDGLDATELRSLSDQVTTAKGSRDTRLARETTERIRKASWPLRRCDWAKSTISWAKREFVRITWTNQVQARRQVDEAWQAMARGAECDELVSLALRVCRLLPDPDDSRGDIPKE